MKGLFYVCSAVMYAAIGNFAMGTVIKNDNVDPVLVLKESKRPNFVLSASALFNANAKKFGLEATIGGKFNLIKGNRLSFFLSPEAVYRYIPMSLTETDKGTYSVDEHYNKIEKTLITKDIKYIPAVPLVDNGDMDISNVIKNAVSYVIRLKAEEILANINDLKRATDNEIAVLSRNIETLNTEIRNKEKDFNDKSIAYDNAQSKYYKDIERQKQAEVVIKGGVEIGLTDSADKDNTKGLKDRLEDSKTAYEAAAKASEEANTNYSEKDTAYTNIVNERNSYTSNMIEAQNKVNDLKDDISTLESNINEIREQIEDLKIDDLRANYDNLLAAYSRLGADATEEAKTEAEAKKNEAYESLKNANEQKGAFEEQIRGKEEELNSKNGELVIQNNIVTENNTALLNSQEAFDKAAIEKSEAENAKTEAEAKKNETKDEFDSLQKTYDKVDEIISTAEETNKANEEAANSAKTDRDKAQKAFVDASTERNKKQEQIRTTQQKLIDILSEYSTSSLEDLETRIKDKIESSSEIYMSEDLRFSSSIQHMAFASVRIGFTMNNKFSPYVRPMIGVLVTNNLVSGSRYYMLKIEGDENHYLIGAKQVEESRKLSSLGYGGGIGFDYHFTKNFFVNIEYSFTRSSFDVKFEKEKLERTMTHNLHYVKIGFGIQF